MNIKNYRTAFLGLTNLFIVRINKADYRDNRLNNSIQEMNQKALHLFTAKNTLKSKNSFQVNIQVTHCDSQVTVKFKYTWLLGLYPY